MSILLDAPPRITEERIARRGRPEEKNISPDYLRQLHEAHGRWYDSEFPHEKYRVDATRAADEVARDVVAIVRDLLAREEEEEQEGHAF